MDSGQAVVIDIVDRLGMGKKKNRARGKNPDKAAFGSGLVTMAH